MDAAIRQYLVTIGRKGGSVTSPQKEIAVRANGAKGGRPRRDGMPPGSKPLEEVLELIETSPVAEQAKLDFAMLARQSARLYKRGQPWLPREEVLRIRSSLHLS